MYHAVRCVVMYHVVKFGCRVVTCRERLKSESEVNTMETVLYLWTKEL